MTTVSDGFPQQEYWEAGPTDKVEDRGGKGSNNGRLKIMSLNVNGLVTRGSNDKMADLSLLVRSEGVDVLCVQELNNVMNKNTRGALRAALQEWQQDSFAAVSTSTDRPRESDY